MADLKPSSGGTVFGAMVALGLAVYAFIEKEKQPAAAKPASSKTVIVHDTVTKVVHSAPPVSGTDIVLILLLCLLATVALFAIGTGRN